MNNDETSTQAEAAVTRYLEHAQVQMLQAGMAQGGDRESLLDGAKDGLIRAERLRPGSGAWLLACISASSGNGDLCRKWLERALKYGTLPGPAELAQSAYLEGVRGQKWFKILLRDVSRDVPGQNA
jgi:hypothetical protein